MHTSIVAKTDYDALHVMKRLAKEVYNELLLKKYKRSIFTKFSGDSDPCSHHIFWDRVWSYCLK